MLETMTSADSCTSPGGPQKIFGFGWLRQEVGEAMTPAGVSPL
jgi:hypothetical protein